ncbi:transcriptional regulator [Empedobacter falsenii]|uniref:transcriptional regulator n=1 Tax=Empedobacter stercoris TaxID=1628248 RepID=UPI0016625A7F|nr:transcriptional regulator [Empedobacter stercoris]MCA4776517.1 transcriptional regulator [Empedobacter stercoris]MCA4808931.1 transcriptional regulator [Empedobacter stercoris]QNT14070.1 transcriptional regulator [Empedobacter stercoris]
MNIDNHAGNMDLFCSFSAFLEKTYKFPPLTAKLQAYMVLESTEEGFTFEELLEVFNVSKSSLSNSINYLLSMKHIEYINKINSRKRYFRLNFNYLIEKLDFLYDMISQDIVFTDRIKEHKMLNNSLSKNIENRVIDIYLDHLNQTKSLLGDTIEKINKIQLENK